MIKVLAPASLSPVEVQIKIIYDGVIYTNESVYYTYKTYSVLGTINPNFGPSQGGTLILVSGVKFDD